MKNIVSDILDFEGMLKDSEHYKDLSKEELIKLKDKLSEDLDILRQKIKTLSSKFTQDNLDWHKVGLHLAVVKHLLKQS